jgi:hypothetical protein
MCSKNVGGLPDGLTQDEARLRLENRLPSGTTTRALIRFLKQFDNLLLRFACLGGNHLSDDTPGRQRIAVCRFPCHGIRRQITPIFLKKGLARRGKLSIIGCLLRV